MLVISIPVTSLEVVAEGESMLCSLLFNFIEDKKFGLVTDLCVQSSECDKSFGNRQEFLSPTRSHAPEGDIASLLRLFKMS